MPLAAALTGARRRASRQMKNEIPAKMMIAPRAITIALLPLKLLAPDELVVELLTTGGVVAEVPTAGWGNEDKGLVGLAAAAAPTDCAEGLVALVAVP
jgi:hypothetical protein